MKLILIDGGPASGKNTLGQMLVNDFNVNGEKTIILDHDTYVERFCPTWIWENEKLKETDLLAAGNNFIKDIDKFLKESFNVVAIGVRFLTKDDVTLYTGKLTEKPSIYLFHLSIPIELRRQRINDRGHHSLIDLDKDQNDRNAIKSWPGYVYQNIKSPDEDAKNLLKLIRDGKGIQESNS